MTSGGSAPLRSQTIATTADGATQEGAISASHLPLNDDPISLAMETRVEGEME